jgi:transcriptional regulator with XRE-family HTH domain
MVASSYKVEDAPLFRSDRAVPNAIVAVRIRGLREKHGYSEEYIADLMGISQPAYRKYEHGGGVTADRLLQLCSIYGCSADYILGLVDNPAEILAEEKLPLDERNFLLILRSGKLPAGFRRLLGALDLPDDYGKNPTINSGDQSSVSSEQETSER